MRMNRLVVILTMLAVVAGCAGPEDLEAQRRRDAFRVPGYEEPQGPDLDRAGQFLLEAAPYYHSAIAETDPIKKKKLLHEAVQRYQMALEEFRALRAKTKDERRREELDLIIMQIQDDLNDTLRKIPITGE
jgi:hypothetical protein